MKGITKYKVEKAILIPLLIFAIISVITVNSATNILSSEFSNLAIKQIVWYLIGFSLVYLIMFIGNDYFYKHAWILYILGVISLIGLLLFAEPINNAKCWFSIPGVGTIQPSEFMNKYNDQ